MREKMIFSLMKAIAFVTALSAVFCFFVRTVRSVEASRSAEELRIAEEAIRRAAATCYCIEGRFPHTYDYLRDNYGLLIDEERYAVQYYVFAQNIMPDITVVER